MWGGSKAGKGGTLSCVSREYGLKRYIHGSLRKVAKENKNMGVENKSTQVWLVSVVLGSSQGNLAQRLLGR